MTLTRRGRLVATLAATGAVLAVAVPIGLATLGPSARKPPPCTLRTAGGDLALTTSEAATATRLAARAERDRSGASALAQALRRDLPTLVPPNLLGHAARALLGYDGPALRCQVTPRTGSPQPETARGLTPRAAALLQAIRSDFGSLPVGGFAAGGVDSGHIAGSAHYEGRAIDVFFRPVNAENQRRGWVLANWAVAHAEALAIATVIFDRHVWQAFRSDEGWRPYRHPNGPTTNPILLHLDHVHVDVLRGR